MHPASTSDPQIALITMWIHANYEIRQNREVRRADYVSGPPSLVKVEVEPYAEPLRCYFNVKEKIVRDGGKAIFGWSLYSDGHLSYKAQHHAVWQSAIGEFYDITPNEAEASHILFMADERVPYDYDKLRAPPLLNYHSGLGTFWWSAPEYGVLAGYALLRAEAV